MPGVPDHVLVHTAMPLTYEEPQSSPAEWIEGEPGSEGGGQATRGKPFACVLFLPTAGAGDQANDYRRRLVSQPTLLFNPRRTLARAGDGIAPSILADNSLIELTRESDVLISAAELAPWTGAETLRWTLVGDPQPAGKPGTVYVLEAILRRVED